MKFIRLLLLTLLAFYYSTAYADSFYASFGEYESGLHASPTEACLSLGNIIYPLHYSRPITGVTGLVDETHSSSCATDVSYAVAGNVYWAATECYTPDTNGLCSSEPQVCDDGFPPNAGDYTSCDRPDLKQCSDGSFVLLATGICPQVCFDYDTCQQYAFDNQSCSGATSFEFTYVNPDNWSSSCTTIADSSPDHENNGGNQDGNENNDPTSPPTTPSSDVDPATLASAIGNELQDDFGNVERAIRDGIDADNQNTNTLKEAIDNVTTNNQQGFSDITSAMNSNASQAHNDALAIAEGIDGLSSQIGALTNELENDGPCDPTQKDYYSCLDNPSGSLPSHTQAPTSFGEANTAFKARLDSAPVVVAFSGMASMISFQNASCPSFSIDLPAPINETVSTTVHCDLYESISGVLSTVMILIWTFIGFRIFASA